MNGISRHARALAARLAVGLGALALVGGTAGAAEDPLAQRLEQTLARQAPWLQARAAAGTRAWGELPLRFEANRGQLDPSAAFVARTDGALVFVRAGDLSVALPDARRIVRLRWLGAAPAPAFEGEAPLAARTHYFAGRDAASWRRDVPSYERVRARAIYPGIDLVLYGRDGALEFDFVVAPGAASDAVRFRVEGADAVALEEGALQIRVGEATLRLATPVVYQEADGTREPVAGRYALDADGSVRFALGAYDSARALVIDPVLAYSTYLGGAARDLVHDVAVDAKGFLHVAGRTESVDFPLVDPLFASQGAGYSAFVAKLDPSGTELVWSTLLGGTRALAGFDQMGIDVDSRGNVVVTGETNDPAFPLANAWQSTLGGGFDAYVTKLTPAGDALVFSTLLGGSGEDYGRGVAFDAEGLVHVTGITFSADFPLYFPVQPSFGGQTDAFVTRFKANGEPILSTYLGGSNLEWGYDVAGGSLSETVVVGFTASADFPTTPGAFQPVFAGGTQANPSDVFVAKIGAATDPIAYATYVGGSDGEEALGVALDADGEAYVVGWTLSPDFPTANAFQATPRGSFDAFALRLGVNGTTLVYSTRLGGTGIDWAYAVAVGDKKLATVVGSTASSDFPLLTPLQSSLGGGASDGFVTRLSAMGNGLVFSSYLGGSGEENPFGASLGVDLDPKGNVYVGQSTLSTDFPLAPYVPVLQRSNAGLLEGALSRISTGPEVQLRLRPGESGTSGRFRVGNGATTQQPLELRFWVDSPALGGQFGVLTITKPIVLPAGFAFFELAFDLPGLITFPGAHVGLRLLDPTTGAILSESICGTVPCN